MRLASFSCVLTLVALAALNVSVAAFQSKTPRAAGVQGKNPKLRATQSVPANKVYGTVVRNGVIGTIVAIGMPNRGRVEVETKSATIRDKAGALVRLSQLTPGSNISAQGKLVRGRFNASSVTVNYLRPLGHIRPRKKDVRQLKSVPSSPKAGRTGG